MSCKLCIDRPDTEHHGESVDSASRLKPQAEWCSMPGIQFDLFFLLTDEGQSEYPLVGNERALDRMGRHNGLKLSRGRTSVDNSLGDRTVGDVRSDNEVVEALVTLTGLLPAHIIGRIEQSSDEATLRQILDDQWPASPDIIGRLTMGFVRRWGLRRDVEDVLGITPHLFTRRLKEEHGRTLVRNAFADRWPGSDEGPDGDRNPPNEEPSLEVGIEDEDSSSELITKPFDPNLIRVKLWTPTVDLVMKRLKANEIDLAPDFQRAAGIWKDRAQSQLIESLLIRIPLPAFYVDASNEDKLVVVDGIQRFTALRRFLLDRDLALNGLEYLTELNGATADRLPRSLARRLEETMLTVYLIEKGTPERAKLNIFKRLNTGGEPLTAQEIRHAMNAGPVREYLKVLSQSEPFLRATEGKFSDDRMTARECALRFCAFVLTPPERYPADADLDSFLHDAMIKLNEIGDGERATLARRLDRAMVAAELILGNQAFRKPKRSGSRSLVNKALFEAWAVGLDGCSDAEIARLCERREQVFEMFRDVFESNREFDKALSQGTGDRQKVRLRFALVADLLREVAR